MFFDLRKHILSSERGPRTGFLHTAYGGREMTERNLTWRGTLLVAYEKFGGEADNVLITNFIVDLIKWDGDWSRLHAQLSKYKAQLAEAGHLEKVRDPAPKRPGLHRLTPAGREAASRLLCDDAARGELTA